MNRTIEIIIGTAGEIQIDAVGFKGPDCEKATEFLEEALGVVRKKVKKPELPWYSSEELTAKKAQEVQCPAYAGEGWQQWRARISQKIKQLEEQICSLCRNGSWNTT